MRKLIQDALILCIITLTAGALLASVYEITKEPIRMQGVLKQQRACQDVFASATSFEEKSELILLAQEEVNKDGFTMEIIDNVLLAKDEENKTLGYVFQITEKDGYGGDIVFMVGIQNDGTVNGISILSIDETPGLGMNAKEDTFKSQFNNKKVNLFTYTKTGSTSSSEIDAISGATVTTKAIVNGVNASISAFNNLVEEGQ